MKRSSNNLSVVQHAKTQGLYWQYVEDLFTPLDDHSQFSGKKKFYKFIKHKKSDYNGVAALKVDGRMINDSKGKADVLNQHFQSIFTQTSELCNLAIQATETIKFDLITSDLCWDKHIDNICILQPSEQFSSFHPEKCSYRQSQG